IQVRPQRLQLRLPPQTARTHARPPRQILNRREVHRNKHVSRILSLGDRRNFESRRHFGRQVLQAMDREVDSRLGQGFFDLLGEHPLRPDLRQRYVRDLVAGRLNDLDLDFVASVAQQRGNMIGLPKGELRTSRTDAQPRHQRLPPEPAVEFAFASFSRKLKSRRTRSTTVVASDSFAAVFSVLIGVCMILLMIPFVRASTANSCSGLSSPKRPRTRSISAWRMVSRWSCKLTIVGTTSSVWMRAWKRCTSSPTIASARSASFLRSATWAETACCRSSMSYTKMPPSLFMPGSTSRGTAISMKNM